jgi:hypothetical protein
VTESDQAVMSKTRLLLIVAGRLLLLPAAIALIGSLVLGHLLGGSPMWVVAMALASAVPFGFYWLLSWKRRRLRTARRILLGITLLLLSPALILMYAPGPWQHA